MDIALPREFLINTELTMGKERFERFLKAFEEEPPVSIRVNRGKVQGSECTVQSAQFTANSELKPVPWCAEGFYLPQRPNFTFDPLLHAGCYYVQEAASQFAVHSAQFIIQNAGLRVCHALDLCAAPGGKSTALRSVLPEDCLLVSNEPVRQRAMVLSENMQKWGSANCVVTNNYPRDFARNGFKDVFDLVLCDVPCSGEGMFRKDPVAISEWSPQNVEHCWQLQRQIVSDIWPCLRPGGIMIYSTCTFNTKENEENVKWIAEQLGADIIPVPVREEWGITGSLLPGFDAPVYRFIPGLTRSEGLFVAILHKRGAPTASACKASAWSRLNVIFDAHQMQQGSPKGKDKSKDIPSCAEALSVALDRTKYPVVDLPYPTAIAYLRREAIVLPPDTPRGLVVVAFMGHPLGFVKNIGSRANNLYPREWAIKSTHLPADYTPVIQIR